MIILSSDLLRKYKKYRRLAEYYGKLIILKDNQPDAVLLPIAEYEKLSGALEETGNFDKDRLVEFLLSLPDIGNRKTNTLAQLKYDLNTSNVDGQLRK